MASSVRWCAPCGVFPSIFGRFLSLLVLGSKVRLLGEPRCMGTSPYENSQLCQVITLLQSTWGARRPGSPHEIARSFRWFATQRLKRCGC